MAPPLSSWDSWRILAACRGWALELDSTASTFGQVCGERGWAGMVPVDVQTDVREIGHLAVWTVTSAKPGNGVELLRDGSEDTYWQSDGTQPHLVDIQFQKKIHIQEVALYLDYRLDESYTPKVISIRAGNSFTDMCEIHSQDLDEPHGWTRIQLKTTNSLQGEYLKAFCIQLAVLSNHQNGRDTHIRQIKIFGPRRDPLKAMGFPLNFTCNEFASYATIR